MSTHQRSIKIKMLTVLNRRIGRSETFRLAAYARAMRFRRDQQRVYKPRMELWDDGRSRLITATFELPGLRPEDVAVDVVEGRLIVSGERRQLPLHKAPAPKQDDIQMAVTCVNTTCLQVGELKYGFFRRVVALPADCTTSDLGVTMENGMLTVSWPRDPHLRL